MLFALSWLVAAEILRLAASAAARSVLPLAASLLACVLAGLVAPRTNRIYYDEQIYQGIGQNLSDLRLAQMCNDGTRRIRQAAVLAGRIQQGAVRVPLSVSAWSTA